MIDLARRAALQTRMSITDLDSVLDSMYGGTPTYTGKLVSQATALRVSTVWACINGRALDVARAPLLTYRLIGDGKELAKDHYLWRLFQHEANPEMTAFRFKHLMQTWFDLWGNAYAEIEISGRGQVVALWPWRPDRVTISRQGSPTGPLQYTYKMQDGQRFTLPADRIFHLRGLGIDGVTGLSPIEQHKQTVGLSMAIQEHGARYYSNGAQPSGGYLAYPGKLSEKAYESLAKDWAAKHQGLENAHRIAILEEGLTYKEVGASMVDAAYLGAMNLAGEDICRIYGFPQHRAGFLARSTNNNIEQQGLEYIQDSFGPLAENWASEINFALLSGRERQTIETKFNVRHLLQGDHAAMGLFMSQMAQNGLMNDDELREEFLDMNPKPNGDGKRFYKQVNMEADGNGLLAPSKPPPAKPNGKPNGAIHQ